MTKMEIEEQEIKFFLVSYGHDSEIIQATGYNIEKGHLHFIKGWDQVHTVHKHSWRSVTSCDKNGDPLWQKAREKLHPAERYLDSSLAEKILEADRAFIDDLKSGIRKYEELYEK